MTSNEGGLTDRDAAIDAVVRFVIGIDDADTELLESSLTDDVVFDPAAFNKTGSNHTVTAGKQEVVSLLMSAVGTSLDTTHMTSNFRVTITGDSANLSCYALAQHFRKGEALEAFQDCYLNGNRYNVKLVRDETLWRIQNFVLLPSWTYGHRSVMDTNSAE